MTKSQINYIVTELLDDEVDTVTPLRNCAYFALTKRDVKFTKHLAAHYYFDTTNEMVRIMPYQIVDKIPSHGNYFQVGSVIYEYITDDKGLCCDLYPFSEIILFKVMEGSND